MSLFTDRLLSTSSKDVQLRLTIDGVPIQLDTSTKTTLPALYVDGRGMLVSVSESRTVLDRSKRTQIGGGFTAVVQDRDNRLRALFAVRSFRTTYVTGNVSKTATTIPVASTAGLPSLGIVYINGETILFTGKTSTTLTGCARARLGSRAVALRGGADAGASVFTVPPTWLGRRVRLDGYFNDDDGAADLTTLTRLGTYRLEEAPRDLGEGRWELRCSHLSDELARRKIGSGLDELKPQTAASFVTVAGNDLLRIVLPKGGGRMFTQGAYGTHALVKFSGAGTGVGIFKIYDVDLSGTDDVVRVYAANLVASGADLVSLAEIIRNLDRLRATSDVSAGFYQDVREGIGYLTVDSIKHIALLQGVQPSTLVRYVLESKLGTGVGNDLLPGIEPSTLGGPGFRFGADLPATEIDYTSLLPLTISPTWSWVIDEELPLANFLRDLCREANCAIVFDEQGRMCFKPLLPARTASVTISERDVKGKITATVEEKEVFSRVRLECNYDPVDGDFEGSVDVVDEEIAASYTPVESSLVIESRAVVVDPVATGGAGSFVRAGVNSEELLPALRRTMLGSRSGGLVLTFVASPRHFDLRLGDGVVLAFPGVSDFRGGTLAAARGRIIERAPDLNTFDVVLSVVVEETTTHFATSAVVTARAGTTYTIDTSDFGYSATPLLSPFRVGDALRVVTAAGTVFGAGLEVISVPSATQIVVADIDALDPSTTSPLPAALLLMVPDNSVAADGFGLADFAFFDGTTRWI